MKVRVRPGSFVDRLTVIEGPVKSGKTMALVNAAKAALLNSKRVLFIALEENEHSIRLRFDSTLRESKMLTVWSVKSMGLTPGDIHREVQACRRGGIVFDAVFVDFANLLAHDKPTGNRSMDMALILETLHDSANGLPVDIMTAVQTARVPELVERKKADDTEGGSCD